MPKPRRKLSDLVQEETRKPAEQEILNNEVTNLQTQQLTDLQTSDLPDFETPEDPELQLDGNSDSTIPSTVENQGPKPQIKTEVTDLQSKEIPKYLQFERKEAKLRQDQVDALIDLTRKLNRKRGKKGERLTDNTLIRVAVDLLLSQADRLEGATETELKKSMRLEVTE